MDTFEDAKLPFKTLPSAKDIMINFFMTTMLKTGRYTTNCQKSKQVQLKKFRESFILHLGVFKKSR